MCLCVCVCVPCSNEDSTTGVLASKHTSLEGVLLSLAPAELLYVEPLHPHTLRTLQAYVATAPGCRLERVGGWGAEGVAGEVKVQGKLREWVERDGGE